MPTRTGAVAVVAAAAAAVVSLLTLVELRRLRRLLSASLEAESHAAPAAKKSVSTRSLPLGPGSSQRGNGCMTAAGLGRMRTVGSLLTALPREEHNKLVAALSRRAAPVAQWGPVHAGLPDVVDARLSSLQTGDLVLTSTRVGSWVGNTVQVLTDSTWNHVAVVIRGRLTRATERDRHDCRHDSKLKQYVPRTPWHFVVTDDGEPHLFEASWQGVHIYPRAVDSDGNEPGRIHDRLLRDPAYEECEPSPTPCHRRAPVCGNTPPCARHAPAMRPGWRGGGGLGGRGWARAARWSMRRPPRPS